VLKITQPSRLHGCRFRAKHGSRLDFVCPLRSTQNVYFVCSHEIRDFVIAHLKRYHASQSALRRSRSVVASLLRKIVVAENFESAAIVSGEHRLEKLRHRMVPKSPETYPTRRRRSGSGEFACGLEREK